MKFELRNNPLHNLLKDFYYKYICFRNIPHEWKRNFVETEFRGIKIKFLLYTKDKENFYDSKYLNENLMSLHLEIPSYLQLRDVGEGDVVLDCGAYNGAFAIYACKKVGSKGKVICFEPDEDNAKILEKNMKLNKCKNYVLIKRGLSDKEKTVKFISGGVGAKISDEGDMQINVTSLDKEIERLKIPYKEVDFVKMDIEGEEMNALKGAKDLLSKNHPYIAVASYHLVDGEKTWKKVSKILKEFKYPIVKTGYPKHLTTIGI